MPLYTVRDEQGRTLTLSGDSPPTEEELEELFSSQFRAAPMTQADIPDWQRGIISSEQIVPEAPVELPTVSRALMGMREAYRRRPEELQRLQQAANLASAGLGSTLAAVGDIGVAALADIPELHRDPTAEAENLIQAFGQPPGMELPQRVPAPEQLVPPSIVLPTGGTEAMQAPTVLGPGEERQELGAVRGVKQLVKDQPMPVQALALAPQGLVRTLPAMAAAGMGATLAPFPVAAGAVFGATPEGFDPKAAAIAAALPYVGRYSGEIAGSLARATGIENTQAINIVKSLAGMGGAAGVLIADQAHAISQLPPDKRKDAYIDMWAGVAGQMLLGPMGVKFEKPDIRGEYARKIREAAKIHGDVRTQSGQGPGQVPAQEGRPGVQPQAKGRVAEKAPEEVLLDAEELAYLKAERAAIEEPIEVVDSAATDDPFARHRALSGQFMGINSETGTIEIYPEVFRRWLKSIPEGRRRQAVRSRINEEQWHLRIRKLIGNAGAEAYWNNLSNIEQAIAARYYLGSWTIPEAGPGARGITGKDMGHEVMRRRLQRLEGMTPGEIAESVLAERWTLRSLEALESVVRMARESWGTRASAENRALVDLVSRNLAIARAAIQTRGPTEDEEGAPGAVYRDKGLPPEGVDDLIQNYRQMGVQDFMTRMRSVEGGLTGEAYNVGLSLKNEGQLRALEEARMESTTKGRALAKAGNLNDAMVEHTRGQFWREAYEAATGTGSAGFSFERGTATPETPIPFPREEEGGPAARIRKPSFIEKQKTKLAELKWLEEQRRKGAPVPQAEAPPQFKESMAAFAEGVAKMKESAYEPLTPQAAKEEVSRFVEQGGKPVFVKSKGPPAPGEEVKLIQKGGINYRDFVGEFSARFGPVQEGQLRELFLQNIGQFLEQAPGARLAEMLQKMKLVKKVVGGGRPGQKFLRELPDAPPVTATQRPLGMGGEFDPGTMNALKRAISRATRSRKKEEQFNQLLANVKASKEVIQKSGWRDVDEQGNLVGQAPRERVKIGPTVPREQLEDAIIGLLSNRKRLENFLKKIVGEDITEREGVREIRGQRVQGQYPVTVLQRYIQSVGEPPPANPLFETRPPPEGETMEPRFRRRAKAIAAIMGEFQKQVEQTRKSVGRTEVTTEELGNQQTAKERVFYDIDSRELTDVRRLGQLLTEDARAKGRNVEDSKRLVVLLNRKTGEVEMVSIWDAKKDVGVVVRNPGLATNRVQLATVLKTHRVLYSVLLEDPVRGFRKTYKTLSDFQKQFGNEARFVAEQAFYESLPVEGEELGLFPSRATTGREAVPGILQREPGALTEGPEPTTPTSEIPGTFRTRPSIQEGDRPLTDAEAANGISFILEEVGKFEGPEDMIRVIEAFEDLSNRPITQQPVMAINAINKMFRNLMEDYAVPPGTLLELLGKKLYEFDQTSKTFDEFVQRTVDEFSRPTVPRRPEPTPEVAAELAEVTREAEAAVRQSGLTRAQWFAQKRREAMDEWMRGRYEMGLSAFTEKSLERFRARPLRHEEAPPPTQAVPEPAPMRPSPQELAMPAVGEAAPGMRPGVVRRPTYTGEAVWGGQKLEAQTPFEPVQERVKRIGTLKRALQISREAEPVDAHFTRMVREMGKLREEAYREAEAELAEEAAEASRMSYEGPGAVLRIQRGKAAKIANDLVEGGITSRMVMRVNAEANEVPIETVRAIKQYLLSGGEDLRTGPNANKEQFNRHLVSRVDAIENGWADKDLGLTAAEPGPGATLRFRGSRVSDLERDADMYEAALVNEYVTDPAKSFARWYGGWMAQNIRASGGRAAGQFADIAEATLDRTKEIMGELAPHLNPALVLAGGTKEFGIFQQVPTPKQVRATVWLNGLKHMPDGETAISRTPDAIEGRIEVPEFARETVNASFNANYVVGGLILDNPSGAFQRNHTAWGFDLFMDGKSPEFNHVVRANARLNSTPETRAQVEADMRSMWTQWRAEMNKPLPDINKVEKINQDFIRRYPITVTHVRTKFGWQQIIHTDLHNYLKNVALRTAHVTAFREQFPNTPEGRARLAELDRSVRSELNQSQVKDLNALIKTLQGRPTDSYNQWGVLAPGKGWTEFGRALNDTAVGVARRMVLTGQMITQTPESLVSPFVFFSARNVLESARRFKQLWPLMETNGQINKLVYDFSIDPANPIRSGFRFAGNVVSKAYFEHFLNEFQGKWFAANATVAVERLLSDRMSPREQADLKETFRNVGFTSEQATRMINGDVELLRQFERRMPTWAVGENKLMGEGSRLGANRLFNSIFRFQLYPMTKLNQFRAVLERTAEANRTGTTAEKVAANKRLAAFLFGTAAQGAMLGVVAAYGYGSTEGARMKIGEALDEPIEFLIESLLGAMSGPLYLVWSGARWGGWSGIGEQATRMAFPFSIGANLVEMVARTGPYDDMTLPDAVGKFLEQKTPGYRVMKSQLAQWGLSQENAKLEQNIKALYAWKRSEFGRDSHELMRKQDERKKFRTYMGKAYRARIEGDLEAAMAAESVAAGALPPALSAKDRLQRLHASYMQRRVLKNLDGGPLSPAEQDRLIKRIGQDAYNRLERFDNMLKHAAGWTEE